VYLHPVLIRDIAAAGPPHRNSFAGRGHTYEKKSTAPAFARSTLTQRPPKKQELAALAGGRAGYRSASGSCSNVNATASAI